MFMAMVITYILEFAKKKKKKRIRIWGKKNVVYDLRYIKLSVFEHSRIRNLDVYLNRDTSVYSYHGLF